MKKTTYYDEPKDYISSMFGVYNHGDLVLARALRKDAIIAIQQLCCEDWAELKKFMIIRKVMITSRW